jgi:hypothetical protein
MSRGCVEKRRRKGNGKGVVTCFQHFCTQWVASWWFSIDEHSSQKNPNPKKKCLSFGSLSLVHFCSDGRKVKVETGTVAVVR